ncbi:MAG: FHA domain-containing protein [Sandaracinus sp.]|nr:FHA domain-containing protein [Sandaracinus sp.]
MTFPFVQRSNDASSFDDRLPVLLVSTFDRGVARRVVVDALPYRIGSGVDCNLRLSAVTVSRLHAELLWQGGRLLLRDAGSLNGTFVEGARVLEVSLEDQQRVRIGPYRLQLRWVSLDGVVESDATASCGAA